MGVILCAALANQIQVPFIATRNIYEVRERPSRMYSWTALLASQLLSELPWNILGMIQSTLLSVYSLHLILPHKQVQACISSAGFGPLVSPPTVADLPT